LCKKFKDKFCDKNKENFSLFFQKLSLYILFYKLLFGDNMSSKRSALLLRLREEDREVIRQLAKYYDIAEADVVKILIHEYMKNHKIEVGSSSSS
jgi:hypothetical protein